MQTLGSLMIYTNTVYNVHCMAKLWDCVVLRFGVVQEPSHSSALADRDWRQGDRAWPDRC